MRKARTVAAGCILALLLLTAPGNLRAEGPAWLPGFPLRAGDTIMLMWSPSPGASSYRVFRKAGDGKFVEVYSGAGTVFQDRNVPEGVGLSYKVEALVPGRPAESSPEAVIRGVESVRAPSLTGAVSGPDRITLRWSTPPGAVFFNVYRAAGKEGAYSLVASLQQDTYVDREIAKGTVYSYQVTAVDAMNRESARSDPVRASSRDDSAGRAEEKPVLRKAVRKGTFRGEPAKELDQPGEALVLPAGEFGVIDRSGIQVFGPEGDFARRIPFGKNWGLPAGAALDPDGKFLVAFYRDGLVRRIDPAGQLEREIGYPLWRDASSRTPAGDNAAAGKAERDQAEVPSRAYPRNNPNGVAVDANGHYWVADGVRGQLVKVSRDGKLLRVVGRPPGTDDPRFRDEPDLAGARRVHFNPVDGMLYLVLGPRAEVAVIDPATAKVVRSLGGVGTGNARFQGVGGVAFRKNGNILVLDHLMRVVKEFTRDSRYVATYVDVVERDRAYLSSNLPTSMAWREETRTLLVTSAMGNVVHRFMLPE